MWYLFEYPLFARCKEGKMGIPASTPENDVKKRTVQNPYGVTINSVPIIFHGYSLGHAVRMAGQLRLDESDVVMVRREE